MKKKSNQVKIGRTGRKNCLVTGMSSASISKDAAAVLTSGPGAWLMESEKMATMINIKYCPSLYDHLCVLKARIVSEGSKEVSIEAIDDAGDCAERNLDRNRLRMRLGMGFGIEGHEKGIFAFVKVFGDVDA